MRQRERMDAIAVSGRKRADACITLRAPHADEHQLGPQPLSERLAPPSEYLALGARRVNLGNGHGAQVWGVSFEKGVEGLQRHHLLAEAPVVEEVCLLHAAHTRHKLRHQDAGSTRALLISVVVAVRSMRLVRVLSPHERTKFARISMPL